MAKLLGEILTIRKADEMWAKGMAVLEEIAGKYPDLVGLAEIIKPAKNVIDKTPVTTSPSQPHMPKEAATVGNLGSQKLYPSSHINTLGIKNIPMSSMCKKHLETMEQLMLISIRNTQKNLNMACAPIVASLLGMVTAFGLIPRSTSEIFSIFLHNHLYIPIL